MMRPAWVGRTLFIGAGVIAFANVIALGGVAYNRAGDPDSELQLSAGEVDRNWQEKENSGMSIRLRVRYPDDSLAGPNWLDAAKLREMGFPAPPTSDTLWQRTNSLRREALFVLEFDGPAYHRALDVRRAAAKAADSASAAHPKDSVAIGNALRVHKALDHLERVESRLFVVDAGQNAAALRARYPDRAHYAIVWGRYQVWSVRGGTTPRLVGGIRDLDPLAINVPHRFRGAIVANEKAGGIETSLRPVDVTVAFGKRLEPWIVSAKKP